MGRRITIDSATMLNKGLEIIEACRLFDLPPSAVKVTVHPQSTVHSLVEYIDGSILAQISVTDMRLPILYALSYPERIESELTFDMAALGHLDFEQPDFERFPCLRLAYEAAEIGGAHCIALNAADEVAVACIPRKTHLFHGHSAYNRSCACGNARASSGVDSGSASNLTRRPAELPAASSQQQGPLSPRSVKPGFPLNTGSV